MGSLPREKDQQSGASPEDIQRLAREHWQEYRRDKKRIAARQGRINQALEGKIASTVRTTIRACETWRFVNRKRRAANLIIESVRASAR